MKKGDKVWVECEVEDFDFEGFTVAYKSIRFFAYSKNCKPVEPEAVEKTINDPVNPSHYKQFPTEVIDIIEAAIADAPNNKAAGLHWQVLKYVLRCWFKNGIEDLKKARWYLDRLIQVEEAK